MRTVWVVNHRDQDTKAAAKFGKLQVLIEGKPNIFGVDRLLAELKEKLKDSHVDDYVLPCGSLVVNMLVSGVLLDLHGRLKILLYDFRSQAYLERTLDEEDFECRAQ